MLTETSQRVVTLDNYSSIPIVVGAVICVTTFFCVVAKLWTKSASKRPFLIDDGAIFLSMLLGIGMTLSIAFAATNGMGKHIDTLTPFRTRNFEKAMYATDILYILTLFFSKAAVLAVFYKVTPVVRDLVFIRAVAALLTLSSLTSLFASAFQCPVPHTWAVLNDKCFNQRIFWTYFNAINILIELCLFVIPILIMQGVQAVSARKVIFSAMIVLRLILLSSIGVEIYFRQQAARMPTDRTFVYWKVAVCMQCTQGWSILCGCVFSLSPFFSSLKTGMVRVDDTRRTLARTPFDANLISVKIDMAKADKSHKGVNRTGTSNTNNASTKDASGQIDAQSL